METSAEFKKGLLVLVAGLKGAIGSTLAVAAKALNDQPDLVLPYLMTGEKFPYIGAPFDVQLAGWDLEAGAFKDALERHGVLEKGIWAPYADALDTAIPVKGAPAIGADLKSQVRQLKDDIAAFRNQRPEMVPVLVNLLPADRCHELGRFSTADELYANITEAPIADIAYALAAVESGVGVVNFTPNEVEIPAVLDAAYKNGVPVCGRDGKTGQTYLKVVLASALRARKLFVNGWYSLNILGNADGQNLMDPDHAACKLDNKTDVLEDVLGYSPGQRRFGKSAHKVHIDYYPPRGDAKEAWDVIDFESIFGLPMSLRLNLQGRDSILAAPMVMDLARWMAALTLAGRSGPVSELGFFFKKAIVGDAPSTFAQQLSQLKALEEMCDHRIMEAMEKRNRS